MKRHPRAVMGLALLFLTPYGCAESITAPTGRRSLPPATDGSSLSNDRPPACTEIGQEWVSPSDGATLVCVPGGDYWMGARDDDPKAQPNTRPGIESFGMRSGWIAPAYQRGLCNLRRVGGLPAPVDGRRYHGGGFQDTHDLLLRSGLCQLSGLDLHARRGGDVLPLCGAASAHRGRILTGFAGGRRAHLSMGRPTRL